MNPKFCSHKWDGPTIKTGDSACSSCGWCGISYFDFVNKIYPKESLQEMVNRTKEEVIALGIPSYSIKQEVHNRIQFEAPKTGIVQHIWISQRRGVLIRMSKKKSPSAHGDRLKYMGWTNNAGWPKKLNTGRILHYPKKKLSKSSHN